MWNGYETFNVFGNAHSNNCMSNMQLVQYCESLKHGRARLSDDERRHWLKSVSSVELVQHVREHISFDSHVSFRVLEEQYGLWRNGIRQSFPQQFKETGHVQSAPSAPLTDV